MKLKPLLLCATLILSCSANATVIRFGFGSLEGQPQAAGLGSFTISDVYSPSGRYEITSVDADLQFLVGGTTTFTKHVNLLGSATASYFDARDVRSPINFVLAFGIDGDTALIGGNKDLKYFDDGLDPIRYINVAFAGELPQPTPTPTVPEPSSWAMLIAGFGVIGGALRQRRRASIRLA